MRCAEAAVCGRGDAPVGQCEGPDVVQRGAAGALGRGVRAGRAGGATEITIFNELTFFHVNTEDFSHLPTSSR